MSSKPRTDAVWWYRLGNGFWKLGVTFTAIAALAFIVAWLAKNGEYTPAEGEAISTIFTFLGYSVMLGVLLAVVEIMGPHRTHTAITSVTGWIYTKLRGVVR